MIAVTMTLTTKVHQDILQKLDYDTNNYIFVDKGNDCPNIAQIIRAIEYPMNLFCDIDFIIPKSMTSQRILSMWMISISVVN